jgi:hypothetical protein
MKKKRAWTVPQKTIVLRVSEGTYKLLGSFAQDRGRYPKTQLARYLIEVGLGLEKPGLMNRDGKMWEALTHNDWDDV